MQWLCYRLEWSSLERGEKALQWSLFRAYSVRAVIFFLANGANEAIVWRIRNDLWNNTIVLAPVLVDLNLFSKLFCGLEHLII